MPASLRAVLIALAFVASPLTVSAVAAQQVAGPTAAAGNVGFRTRTTVDDPAAMHAAADDASHPHLGTDVALMIIGGAGFIVGLIIAGPAGIAIAVAGALVGLFGLYMYLR
jgi:hypothetical protein